MESTERAVVRLTEDHTEMTEAGPVEWPPLLDWIRERVTEINRRGSGSGGQGVPLNNDALEILNHIERNYRLICEATMQGVGRELVEGVRRMWRTVCTDRKAGAIRDAEWDKIGGEIESWVQRIEGEQERPRKMELTVPCPRCGNRWVLSDEGDDKRKAAVVIEFGENRAPVAECRVAACEAIWAGWNAVADLGFTLGANQDLAVLEACGINLGETLAK